MNLSFVYHHQLALDQIAMLFDNEETVMSPAQHLRKVLDYLFLLPH